MLRTSLFKSNKAFLKAKHFLVSKSIKIKLVASVQNASTLDIKNLNTVAK